MYSHSVLYTSNVDRQRGYVLPSVSFITLGVGQSEVFLSVYLLASLLPESHTGKGLSPLPRPVARGSNMPW